MNNIILISGEPRVGKTSLIKKIVKDLGEKHFNGFYTEEIKEGSERIGFQCTTLDGKVRKIADVKWKRNKIGRYGVNIKSLEDITFCEDLNINLITIIDEIGPMQALSPKFLKRIENLFNDPSKFVFGTIYYADHSEINKIKQIYSPRIYFLTCNNRKIIEAQIKEDLLEIITNLK